jgi:hypothetical protein
LRPNVKNIEYTLAGISCFEYGARDKTMQMNTPTHTFLAEAACAASLTVALPPANGERRTDDAPALAGRYAS